MKAKHLVLIEDEDILRISLKDDLLDNGYQVTDFANPVSALEYLKHNEPDLVISDIKMPHMDGLELLESIQSIYPGLEVIIMTAFGSVESAVKAMRMGASEYLTKPFEIDQLLLAIEKADKLHGLTKTNQQYRKLFQRKFDLKALVGESDTVKKIKEQIRIVAPENSSVLITGETGTGKELLANIIHFNSNRQDKPLIKVSCAILSRDIFESELFGHKKGAFTGALEDRKGRFEEADGGTIYLDDIDDIPLDLQVKLLRVLQEKEIEKVGSNKPKKIDTRVIASTKADLLELVRAGKFREDLYYRLNVFPINLPPLRTHTEDIPLLISEFEKEFCSGCSIQISEAVQKRLQAYHWPGNIRELKNIVERLVLTCNCQVVNEDKLPPEIVSDPTRRFTTGIGHKSLDQILFETEYQLLQQALDSCDGNQTKAAALLQLPVSTLRTKLLKYKLN